MSSLHAVLTGDIIGSTSLSSEQRTQLPENLRDTFQDVNAVYGNRTNLAFDFFRGDAWQMYMEKPEEALHVAVLFRALLRARLDVDTRIAIAIDTVDFVNSERLSESDGNAFRRSGRALDGLGRRTMTCLLPNDPVIQTDQPLFNAISRTTDVFMSEWTRAQAQAVALTLSLRPESGEYANQKQVSMVWKPEPISQQAVSAHLQRAHWDVISDFLHTYFLEVSELARDFNSEADQ